MTRRPESIVRRLPSRGNADASGPRVAWRMAAAVALALVAVGSWFLLRPSRTARLIEAAIVLQDEALEDTADPLATRRRLETITRHVDQLRPDEIRRVRDALAMRLRTLGERSVERFVDASPDDRTALLDGDIARLQVARAIFEATDQGGMRPFTEAEVREREERRQMTPEERQQADRARRPVPERPAAGSQPTSVNVDRKLVDRYFEALGQRAREKKVDLGRMLPRPPGRG